MMLSTTIKQSLSFSMGGLPQEFWIFSKYCARQKNMKVELAKFRIQRELEMRKLGFEGGFRTCWSTLSLND
jgi:hypothetical protein